MTGTHGFEGRMLREKYGRWAWLLRFMPHHAAHYLSGIELPPHERYWIKLLFADNKDNITVASRGTSKCLGLGTQVMMADGSLRKVEDVRVGDQVMGPDGNPRNVLDTTRGRGPIYRVKQTHGMEYTVNADHILSTRDARFDRIVNINVEKYAAHNASVRHSLKGYKAEALHAGHKLSELSVEPIGEGEYAGFAVDGDHLFLLEDGTVTHNSFSFVSLAAPLKALLFKNLGVLAVSASGFRGGKLLLDDTERLFLGQLRSQQLPGPYLSHSVNTKTRRKVVKRDVDRWTINFKSMSQVMTIPTNNSDQMRGVRANIAIVDERNTFDGEVVQKVIRPMLNVGQDFRKTASGGDKNQIFQISTIDYTVRDWFPEVQSSRSLAQREYEAQRARKVGDWNTYDRLMEENEGELKGASFSYSRFDYMDLLIPDEIIKRDDSTTWKVHYPLPPGRKMSDVTRRDDRDGCDYIYTYPVDKEGLEKPLRDGTMDRELWLAEQRNVFISTAGNVYPHELIRSVSEKPIYESGGLAPGSDEWYAPVMYSCGDPCVVGLDYARESDHFAIVVMRLGELAEGKFDPTMERVDDKGRPCIGQTPWNNVIWAESWQRWTAAEAAARIREIYDRYNIVRTSTIRGIGLDKGGGGTAVRDELAQPKPPILDDGRPDPSWSADDVVKIFDPEDEDYKHLEALGDVEKYWPGLELLKPNNASNNDWTRASRAYMEKKKVFIAYWQSPSRWALELGITNASGSPDKSNPDYMRWRIGYDGIQRLIRQLLRIQMKVTESGVIRYTVPSDREKEAGKKDLYSAFIYATHMARQHLVAQSKRKEEVPLVEPVAVTVGHGRNYKRQDGWYRKLY